MRLSNVRLLAGMVAVLLSLTATSAAEAQEWLADRKRSEGAGVRVGDFELHPGIGLEMGYDSNVFFSDGSEVSAAIVGSPILRVTPHLSFSTLSAVREAEGEAREGEQAAPPTVQFRGGISASYYAFFADEARNNVGLDADLNLVILPERPFSIILHERFSRVVRPFTEQRVLGSPDLRIDFGRNENDAGVDFSFGTPGRVFGGTVGYSLAVGLFDGEQFQFANSLTHNFRAGASYRFLPQTALVYDFEGQYRTFPSFTGSSASSLLSNGFNMRTRVGVNGAVTTRLSLTAMLGYGAGWYDVRDDFESAVAQVELRWQATTNFRLVAGYDRNFRPSFVGNFMRADRGYANFQLLLGGAFLLGGEASVSLLDFGVPVLGSDASTALGSNPDGTVTRSDVRLSASVFSEYRFTNWLGVNATLRYTGDFTDYRYVITDAVGTVLDPAGYNKFEGWLGVRAFY